jgi:hypothetical protein
MKDRSRRAKLGKLWEKLGADPEVIMCSEDGTDIFIVFDGVKIAKRGHPRTPQARTRASLEPGSEVCGTEQIEILHHGVPVH